MENKTLQFTAISNRVVIHPEEKETVTKNGIIIPDNVEQTVNKGFVVSAGEKVTSVKEGDYVYYDSVRCGTVIFNGVLFHIAHDKEDGTGQIDLILNNEENAP